MDYKGLIEGLRGLINENTAVEQAEKIGTLIASAEQLEADNSETTKAYETMRLKYIEAIKTSSISGTIDNPIATEQKPKTFEDCVQEQIDKRNK